MDPKDMKICNLSNGEFEIGILRKLNKLQVNTETQFNEIKNIIRKYNDKQ